MIRSRNALTHAFKAFSERIIHIAVGDREVPIREILGLGPKTLTAQRNIKKR